MGEQKPKLLPNRLGGLGWPGVCVAGEGGVSGGGQAAGQVLVCGRWRPHVGGSEEAGCPVAKSGAQR